VLGAGQADFPVTVAMTHNGCAGLITPLPFFAGRALGLVASNDFVAAFPGPVGGGVRVFWDGGTSSWRANVTRSGFTADGPLTWDPTAGQFFGLPRFNCIAPNYTEYAVSFTPEMFSSSCVNRNVVDEKCDGGAAVLSWAEPLVMLHGSTAAVSARTTAIWSGGYSPGLFSKYGTSPLPRAGGQVLRFEF
jgi:hypothetical protein